MSNSNNSGNGGPAFPHIDSGCGRFEAGMTLRDYFAAKAMAVIMYWETDNDDVDDVAALAYMQADAMLKARAQ